MGAEQERTPRDATAPGTPYGASLMIRTAVVYAFDRFAGTTISDRMMTAIDERDRYMEALDLIAKTDPVDAALDSERAIRIAREALKKERTNV